MGRIHICNSDVGGRKSISLQTVDERKRAESVEVIHIMGGGSLISKVSDIVDHIIVDHTTQLRSDVPYGAVQALSKKRINHAMHMLSWAFLHIIAKKVSAMTQTGPLFYQMSNTM